MSLFSIGVNAQDTSDDETTASRSWKGVDPSTLSANATFYLYNVGTGKFVIAGGGWGIQAMLKYQDFGAAFSMSKQTKSGLTSLYLINSGAQTGDNSNVLGANYANVTSGQSWGNQEACFGVLFDATSSTNSYARGMAFERVESSSNATTYTYYIKENLYTASSSYYGSSYTLSKTVWLGAKKGFDITATTATDNADINTDEVTYTATESNKTDNKNFMWRFVTRDELKAVIQAENADNYGGLNANVSFLLTDPYFDRNRTDGTWKAESSASSGNTYRLDWFNGSNGNISVNTTGTTTTSTPWNAAVYRKVTLNTAADGKYSFGLLDGIGTVSQSFKVETEGWYSVQCSGLAQGNGASLYISVGSETVSTPLKTVTGFSKVNNNRPNGANYSGLKNIATTLYDDAAGTYTATAMIYVSANSTVTVGIQKDKATQSSAYTSGRTSYYYDTDIVAFDNFNVFYQGKEAPFLLDEDKTDESYIDDEFGKDKNKNVTTYLHRTFKTGKWNSFVLPVSMTNAQVKQYFGDDTKVAKLSGVSTNHGEGDNQHDSKNELCIDFKTISLDGEGTAIEAGHMYIVNPTKAASDVYNVKNEKVEGCYSIGRHNFSGSKPAATAEFGTDDSSAKTHIKYYGSYIKLTYDENVSDWNGPQKGSYVLGTDNNMYHLANAMTIKGFRGWLNIVDQNGDVVEDANLSMSLDADHGTTYIDGVSIRGTQTNDVYTLGGQLVRKNAQNLSGLAKGIYVMNGKKFIVK